MMSRLSIALALFTTLAFTPPASAGQKGVSPVYIDTTFKFAGGGMGSARNSTDGWQQLGCSVHSHVSATGDWFYISCTAQAATGQYASCYVMNPSNALLASVQSMSSDSGLQFAWNDSGQCTQLSVYTLSSYEPKKP